MFFTNLKRETALSIRHLFILLVFAFPILISLGTTGISESYSTLPKFVVLEQENLENINAEGVQVTSVASMEDMKQRVSDVDTAIGVLPDGELMTDGRETEEEVQKARSILEGETDIVSPIERERLFSTIFAFTLYGVFSAGGMILLFKLIEEQENKTIDLQRTEPVPRFFMLAGKLIISAVIVISDFILCAWILGAPLTLWESVWVLALGVTLSLITGMFMAYYAKNESQALAIIKPVTFLLFIALPALGIFVGGVMHTIALFDPFYWLLKLVEGFYLNEPVSLYTWLLAAFITCSLLILHFTWHKTVYGYQKEQA
ncbi:ABC transporter permease subunit [Halobacillus sp. K22]|uniref:ABC transporter permease subunit n=1 Tax=Halobacillus sp. K22 TaxID=3457431 RepID=UPI003FCE41F9